MNAHELASRSVVNHNVLVKPKWKVVSEKFHPTPGQIELNPTSTWKVDVRSDYRRTDDVEYSTALAGYRIQSVGGVPWKNIPDDLKEDNGYWRFIKIKPGITIDDFEVEEIEL